MAAPDVPPVRVEPGLVEPQTRAGLGSYSVDTTIKTLGEGIIPCFHADSDFELSEDIMTEYIALLRREPFFDYRTPELDDRSYAVYSSWFRAHHKFELVREHTVYTQSILCAMVSMMNAFVDPDKKCIVTPPVYPGFTSAITDADRVLKHVHLIQSTDDHYSFDFEGLEKACAEGDVGFFVLCSPHNPTGNIWTRDDIKRIDDICARHKVMLLADEVHAPIIDDDSEFVSFLTVEPKSRWVWITAASKTWNVAGNSCSIISFSCRDDLELFKAAQHRAHCSGASVASRLMTRACFAAGNHWREQANRICFGNMKRCREALAQIGIHSGPARSTYMVWADARAYNDAVRTENARRAAAASPVEKDKVEFLPLFDVATLPSAARVKAGGGVSFGGDEYKDYLRFTLAMPPSTLDELVRRLLEAYVPITEIPGRKSK